MNITKKKFFEDFLANADFDNASQGITATNLEVKTEPLNWTNGIKVFRLASRSEVSITLYSGSIRYCFAYALKTAVGDGDLEGSSAFTIDDLQPKPILDCEVIEGYSSELHSSDEAENAMIEKIFGNPYGNNSYAINCLESEEATVELQLRRAVVAKLARTIEERINDNNLNNPLMDTTSELAKDAFNVAIKSLRSMTDLWSRNPANKAINQA